MVVKCIYIPFFFCKYRQTLQKTLGTLVIEIDEIEFEIRAQLKIGLSENHHKTSLQEVQFILSMGSSQISLGYRILKIKYGQY